MIRKVRVEYMRKHGTPGLLAVAADKHGRIFYENKKALPATKERRRPERERQSTRP